MTSFTTLYYTVFIIILFFRLTFKIYILHLLAASTSKSIPCKSLLTIEKNTTSTTNPSSLKSAETKNSSNTTNAQSKEMQHIELPDGVLIKEGPVQRKDYFTEAKRSR